MAENNLRLLVNETLTTIKQTFDDRTVSMAQVAQCYIIVANQLLSQHNLKRDSGAFLSTFDNVPVNKETASINPNLIKGRKYVELPGLIFDNDKDGAVEYLAYTSEGKENCPPRFTNVPFTRTSPSQAQWLYLHPSTKPSPSNPYFYRVNNLLYLLGIEAVPINSLEMGLYLTIDPLQEIDIDKPFPFPSELLAVLKRQVTDLIRYNWFFGDSRQNKGDDTTDDGKNTNVPKIVSVNDNQEQQ